MPNAELERIRRLDGELVTAVRRLRILGTLSWPEALIDQFLDDWRAGSPALPVVPVEPGDYGAEQAALNGILAELRPADSALERFLHDSATSWLRAIEMLEHTGTARFTECSVALYGHPEERMHPGAPTHLDAARHFLSRTEGFAAERTAPEMSSAEAADWMRERLAPHLPDLEVVLDPQMAARATAGSKRVRLREGTSYGEVELTQLLQHEALVHSATARNGHDQPLLRSLGYGAPRTTATQEGIATFAELITDSMAVRRLRRIALRVLAVHAGLEGADFLEVFTLFLDHGQEPETAARSASRIFRGGDVRGGAVFAKDLVYLRGTLMTHAFLLKAQQSGRGDLARALFVGRLTWGDAVRLQPHIGTEITAGAVLPPWAANDDQLATYLIWSVLHRSFDLDALELTDFER